ncbi:hypothetical protein BQ8482_570041 [Mesorhizobium delmotii]|uniref:Uncharacterized protein n=1 Tax=Mesorhizobium delmotii TaxID=1631247 RepID=A0A2P9AV49_9HYPH|nr:hypothetical protein BQ8482_570041 [Mesorhizobium delmotii]
MHHPPGDHQSGSPGVHPRLTLRKLQAGTPGNPGRPSVAGVLRPSQMLSGAAAPARLLLVAV